MNARCFDLFIGAPLWRRSFSPHPTVTALLFHTCRHARTLMRVKSHSGSGRADNPRHVRHGVFYAHPLSKHQALASDATFILQLTSCIAQHNIMYCMYHVTFIFQEPDDGKNSDLFLLV